VIGSSNAWAVPITWEASGVIEHVIPDAFGTLDDLSVGTPWKLQVTFDPDTPGILLHPGDSPTYLYSDAISNTKFQLGAFEYTNPSGDIYINADLPVFGSSTALGGPGLVQFQWLQGWLGGNGGPDLNTQLGLMLATYNDLNAVDGSLPFVPNRSPVQSVLGGLEWDSELGGSGAQFTSSTFNPLPVPEPTSILLVGTGLGLIAARRRKRKHSA
jgi:hypothetical protein